MGERTKQDLYQLQGLPLNLKISMSKARIRQWIQEYGEDGVYVSFSGGKDSTVLLGLVREEYPNVKAMFCDTGLEYPEIRKFVKTFDNVDWIRPKMSFRQVIEKYGYPFISKEVAECVWGARKYLTRVLEEASLDRPTRHIHTDLKGYADSESLRNLTGVRQQIPQTSGNLELLKAVHAGATTHHLYQLETDKLLGTCRYGKPSARNMQIWQAIQSAEMSQTGGWTSQKIRTHNRHSHV